MTTQPSRRLELLSDRSGAIRAFRSSPEVEAAARRACVAHVVRNAPRASNDELRNDLVELLDMLGQLTPPTPAPRSR